MYRKAVTMPDNNTLKDNQSIEQEYLSREFCKIRLLIFSYLMSLSIT